MSNAVVLAIFFAFLNVLALAAGLGLTLQIPLFALTVFLGVMGLIKPGAPEAERRSRLSAVLAMVLAGMPFLKPHIDAFLLARAEARRAAETAPLYVQLDEAAETLAPALESYHAATGRYPLYFGSVAMPVFDAEGRLIEDPPDLEVPQIPSDPFVPGNQVSILPLGEKGALIHSAGQDGVMEWPRPDAMVAMDGEPADPLAPLIWPGLDLRTVTFDPTNGALSTGDALRWHSGVEGMTRDDALAPLYEAWEAVERLTPPPPEDADEEELVPDPEHDAAIAEELLEDGEWLAALAAASRAVANRRVHPNFWESKELLRADLFRARALYELGHFRKAADYLIDYLQYAPNDPAGHELLGRTLWLGGRAADAEQHFAAAFQLDPDHPAAERAARSWEALRVGRTPEFPMPAAVRERRENQAVPQPVQNQGSTDE